MKLLHSSSASSGYSLPSEDGSRQPQQAPIKLRQSADLVETTQVHRSYDTEGKVVPSEGTTSVDLFAFDGRSVDPSTGLQWNMNRYFDPGLGQWISEEHIGFAGGEENVRKDPGVER